MVASHEVVQPRGRLPQAPVAGRNDSLPHGIFAAPCLQAKVGPDPYALALAGVYFAPAVTTASAGAVPLVLGALRYGAKVGDIEQRTVAAILAAVDGGLRGIFEKANDLSQPPRRVRPTGQGAQGPERWASGVEDGTVESE